MLFPKFSTIKSTDKVICLHGGKVAGHDTHDNLLLNCQMYRELYDNGILKVDMAGGVDDEK